MNQVCTTCNQAIHHLIQQTFKVSNRRKQNIGNTALHWAASAGHIEAVQFLVNELHIPVNLQNTVGDTALHKAAWRGSLSTVQFLCGLDETDIQMKNKEGKRPVDVARHLEVKSYLQSFEGSEEEEEEEEEGAAAEEEE